MTDAAGTAVGRQDGPASQPGRESRHDILFEPVAIGPKVLKNRFYGVPYNPGFGPGKPNANLSHRAVQAEGGWAAICTGVMSVARDFEANRLVETFWDESELPFLRTLVDRLHEHDALAGLELGHAGGESHNADTRWTPVGPSQVPGWRRQALVPKAMDRADIKRIRGEFVRAASAGAGLGFDIIVLYGSFSYLQAQFLSPYYNRRTDEYGGSLENRARLLLRVVRAVREVAGEAVPVFVRLSATDWADDGWDLDSTVRVAAFAREAGADHFDISTGGLVPGVRIPVGPGYQVPFAEAVRGRTGASVNAVGMIRSSDQAESVLASGAADAVMIGREFLRDPHFALRAAHELGQHIDAWPPQYTRARWPEPRRSAERRTA
jgi:2,4-dienoyl-CoA reductase-like NADH-dependent reductase (Old Yellow Enzyme family)